MKSLRYLLLLFVASSVFAEPSVTETFKNIVDPKGNISIPMAFQREWAFLGTWSVAQKDLQPGVATSNQAAAALHNVYVQPDAITSYRKTGEFPDGTVVVKELLMAKTGSMTTGTVSWGHKVEGWFVMVKDRHNRFPEHPLWGDGWGWVLFNADAPDSPVTKNHKTECIGCHIPAKQTDWIYVEGYPVLKSP